MARVHPSSAYWLALAALLPGTLLGLACTSDDLLALTDVDPTTAAPDTTMVYVFTTGEPDDGTSTGEPMTGEDTCREAITCLGNCVGKLMDPPPPEEDYSCFLGCIDDMTTEEWLALIGFGECVYNFCVDTAKCPDAEDEMTCQLCLISNLQLTDGPASCEMKSMTCK